MNARFGPFFVSLAAVLWATDTIFRASLVKSYSPLFIVSVTHLVTFAITALIAWRQRKEIANFTKRDWLALGFLSLGGSIFAMVFYTSAFASTDNFNIPILLQKLQPIMAITLAHFLLKEKITSSFIWLALVAIFGAYLVSFGDLNAIQHLKEARVRTVLYTLFAAGIWGGCTIAARSFLVKHSYLAITSFRFAIATFFLTLYLLYRGDLGQLAAIPTSDYKTFLMMAFFPGLIALFIYYIGLKKTPASVATICELSFPLAAVVINWIFLDSPLNRLQIFGTLLLLGAITIVNIRHGLKRNR